MSAIAVTCPECLAESSLEAHIDWLYCKNIDKKCYTYFIRKDGIVYSKSVDLEELFNLETRVITPTQRVQAYVRPLRRGPARKSKYKVYY